MSLLNLNRRTMNELKVSWLPSLHVTSYINYTNVMTLLWSTTMPLADFIYYSYAALILPYFLYATSFYSRNLHWCEMKTCPAFICCHFLFLQSSPCIMMCFFYKSRSLHVRKSLYKFFVHIFLYDLLHASAAGFANHFHMFMEFRTASIFTNSATYKFAISQLNS